MCTRSPAARFSDPRYSTARAIDETGHREDRKWLVANHEQMCPPLQEGFIKAFSENVEAFTKGFAHAQRLMRNLYVSKLLIWPRYDVGVVVCGCEQRARNPV